MAEELTNVYEDLAEVYGPGGLCLEMTPMYSKHVLSELDTVTKGKSILRVLLD